MRQSTIVRGALALGAVVLAIGAGSARAQGTFAITLSQCSASDGIQFTVNGAEAAPTQALKIVVTTSEPGAFPEPFYVLPAGVTDPNVSRDAEISSGGTFSFRFSAGSSQQLPATISVFTYDTATDTAASPAFYTTTVNPNAACTDGTSLVGTSGGGGGDGSFPTKPAQCKNYAWRSYLIFKSQGDCVSFVAARGKNPPALLP